MARPESNTNALLRRVNGRNLDSRRMGPKDSNTLLEESGLLGVGLTGNALRDVLCSV